MTAQEILARIRWLDAMMDQLKQLQRKPSPKETRH
jgi:hypothetical protein